MIDVLVWLTWAAAPAIAGLLIFIALQHLGRGNPLERIRVVGDPDRLPGAG